MIFKSQVTIIYQIQFFETAWYNTRSLLETIITKNYMTEYIFIGQLPYLGNYFSMLLVFNWVNQTYPMQCALAIYDRRFPSVVNI